jgi:O-antigen/teichoic acid export membrane protein
MSWSSALDCAAKWGLSLLVPLLWDPAIGGFVFLSERIIHRPLQTVSTSLLPVYVADATRALQAEPARVRGLYFATLRKQVPITAGWTALVLFASPYVVEPVFGAGWREAVPIMQVMSLALAPMTILHCVWHTLQLAGRTGVESLFTTARVMGTAAVVLGCRWGDTSAVTMLAVYAGAQAVFAVGLYLAHQAALRALVSRTA